MTFYFLFSSLRPKQWIKNLLIFAPLIFSREFVNPESILIAIYAFLIFCLVASGVYLINDVLDRKNDRQHPLKKNRPIASGKLPVFVALIASGILLFLAIFLAFYLKTALGAIIVIYASLQIIYSLLLKHLILVDLIVIALGFVLRIYEGAVAIDVEVSSWLIAITFLLALLLATGKRLREIQTDHGHKTRKVLSEYSPKFLNSVIKIILPAVLISYLFYSFQASISNYFLLTVPIVVYGLFRYLLLLNSDSSPENPTELLLADKQLLISVVLWAGMVIGILSLA